MNPLKQLVLDGRLNPGAFARQHKPHLTPHAAGYMFGRKLKNAEPMPADVVQHLRDFAQQINSSLAINATMLAITRDKRLFQRTIAHTLWPDDLALTAEARLRRYCKAGMFPDRTQTARLRKYLKTLAEDILSTIAIAS